MTNGKNARLTREDWLSKALEMCEQGIDKVKVAPLAKMMGVTTGSFYWHFKNRQELLDDLLKYWEKEMTDAAIVLGRNADIEPSERILLLMKSVMTGGMARYDLPIWAWAQSDANAARVFNRALKKRFAFSAWMFEQAGFSHAQAKVRSRMMVTYMMAESTLIRDKEAKSPAAIKQKHAILTKPD